MKSVSVQIDHNFQLRASDLLAQVEMRSSEVSSVFPTKISTIHPDAMKDLFMENILQDRVNPIIDELERIKHEMKEQEINKKEQEISEDVVAFLEKMVVQQTVSGLIQTASKQLKNH